jgi:hypothetical protein
MSGYGAAVHEASEGHVRHKGGPISVPWVLLAGLLIGVGLAIMYYWLYDFSLVFLAGPVFIVVGALMFFSPRAGLDRA